MTLAKVREKIQTSNLTWLQTNTILLVRHGSHAYGTNTPTSDEDFKGVCIPPAQFFFGFVDEFEQFESRAPDAVIYEIRKFFKLAAICTPNLIEVLHVDDEDVVFESPLGRKLRDHRQDFISLRLRHSFMGYALSQARRIRNHRRWIRNPAKEPPTRASLGLPEKPLIPKEQFMAVKAKVQKELDRMNFHFLDGVEEHTKIALRNSVAEMIAELEITVDVRFAAAARKLGIEENFIHLLQREREFENLQSNWNSYLTWKKCRNPERASLEEKYGYDTKHAYHLVRLIRMSREIMTTGKVIVKRVEDREELLAIRNGAWSFDQLMDFIEREEKLIQKIYLESSIIPSKPDMRFLSDLCQELIEEILN